MERSQRMVGSILLLTALLLSLSLGGTTRAQGLHPAFVGKFTLTQQIHWGQSVLGPGKYTVCINSTVAPVIGIIRDSNGVAVSFITSQASSGEKEGLNALLIKEKDGQPTVHSLALADLGMILIYDTALAHGRNREARVTQTIPVVWAKNQP